MLRRTSFQWTTRTLSLAAALVVCLAPLTAPLAAQESGAKVLRQVGQVSIQNNGYLQALSEGDQIRMGQVIVTGPDSFATFQVLSDKSTFEVYPNSQVVFRDTPGNWRSLLNIVMGRIKVFIQHAPGVPNPNDVTSPTAVISVRGTVFDVVVPDPDTTIVSLDEGIVDVRNFTAPGDAARLQPGQSITVLRGQRLIAAGIDKGNILQKALQVVRSVYVGMPRTPGAAGPMNVPGGGAQGDKGKQGGNAPGAPPPPPGVPPPPPGGGGN